uniref:Uncharacterized protein n=1 Tax=Physcomitrium patens TaxID=3218 RepID=A0A2K1JX98_PHYPA|nr:hypothetical protein PHYPA_013284 [Physcomitrium patens]
MPCSINVANLYKNYGDEAPYLAIIFNTLDLRSDYHYLPLFIEVWIKTIF